MSSSVGLTPRRDSQDTVIASSSESAGKKLEGDATLPEDSAASIPDGGLNAWLQCVGSFFLLMNSFGVINSFGSALKTQHRPYGG